MKKTKIIIPAMGMLLLGTAASVTGTVAWFSANNKVAITGMQVKTKVSDNLQIAGDTLSSDAKLVDSAFSNSYNAASLKGYLAPVSTVNAKNFYYTSTNNVVGSGNAATDAYIAYEQYNSETNYGTKTDGVSSGYGNMFSENYGITESDVNTFVGANGPALGYIDYVFQVKAVNSGADKNINISQLDLEYNGSKESNSDAYRVAFFVEDVTAGTSQGAAMIKDANIKGIYKESLAANFDANQAVTSVSALGSVTYVSSATSLAVVPASTTKYFKIVARLWLEGEDTTCNNETFIALTNSWSLNLSLILETGTTSAVSSISEFVAITASSYTVTDTNKKTISTTDYNVVTGLKYDGKQVYTTAATGTLATNAPLYTIEGEVATAVTANFKLS